MQDEITLDKWGGLVNRHSTLIELFQIIFKDLSVAL